MYNCNLKKNYIGFNSKGKAIIMKKLGRKGSACMMAIALCAMTVPVFAGSNNKSVKSAKYNAYATEYVGFVSAGSGNTYGYAARDFEGSTYEIHATD